MTTLSTTFTGQPAAASRVADLLARLRLRAIGAKSYDKTIRELSAMSPRDLADIGISAGQIEDIATEGARMAMEKARLSL